MRMISRKYDNVNVKQTHTHIKKLHTKMKRKWRLAHIIHQIDRSIDKIDDRRIAKQKIKLLKNIQSSEVNEEDRVK